MEDKKKNENELEQNGEDESGTKGGEATTQEVQEETEDTDLYGDVADEDDL